MSEKSDDRGYVEHVIKQLKVHGLPGEADALEIELGKADHKPEAIRRLREATAESFLRYFCV